MAEQETQIRQENADEAFKNIHGNPGGSAGVMDAVVIAETAAKVIAATAGAEESVAGGGEMMRAERAVSFSVFWDVANKVYKVHDPVVKFPDGSSTTLGQPTFSAATFIVEVTRKNGVYAAAWKLSTAPADSDRIVAVKIFKLLNSVVTQYHTGAIIVSETSITGESASQEGSTADTVHGNVKVKGDAGSGLIMKTWKQGGQRYLSVGLKGKKNSEIFGIHDVKDYEGNATGTKIFSTNDVQIGNEDEVDVLTGFSLNLNGNELQVTWHKKKIKGVVTEDVADGNPERLMLLENIDVVNSVSYNNPNCTQSRMTIVAFTGQAIQNDPNANVFTTTPHSAEHSGS